MNYTRSSNTKKMKLACNNIKIRHEHFRNMLADIFYIAPLSCDN